MLETLIAIIADPHSSTEHLMEEGRALAKNVRYGVFTIFHRSFGKEMIEAAKGHKHVRETLAKMEGDPENPNAYDMLICLGDLDQMGEEETLQESYNLLRKLCSNIVVVPGNHDTKSFILFNDKWFEDFSQKQLDMIEEIFQCPLYGITGLGPNANLIWLLSDPFIFDWHRHSHLEKKHPETCRLLVDLREKQLEFLATALEFTVNSGKKIVLAVHDPSVLLSPHLRKALDPYRSDIAVILTGHIHAKWLLYLITVAHPIAWPKLLWRMWQYKARLMPSIWGITLPKLFNWRFLWMAGGGWAILKISKIMTLTNFYVNSSKFRGETLVENLTKERKEN